MATNPTGIYALDYTNTVWYLLLPPNKRLPKWLAWGATLMAGKQWYHNSIFGSYMLGSSDPAWDKTATYAVGNRIIYYINGSGNYCGDNAVYEAITSVPANTPPIGTNICPSVAPAWVVNSQTALQWLTTGNNGNPFYWVKVQSNFIGAIEQCNWSCQQLTMEIALNRWFNVSPFANYQWDHTGSPPYTQIYIQANVLEPGEEYWPPSAPYSYWPPLSNQAITYWPPSAEAANQYDFTIYVPVAVFNNLVYPASAFSAGHEEDTSDPTRNGSIIRALVDKFNAIGMFYNIITY